jgi:hypothetical protein
MMQSLYIVNPSYEDGDEGILRDRMCFYWSCQLLRAQGAATVSGKDNEKR